MVPRSPQDRSETGPRAIKKRVLILDSFWGRVRVVLGSFWGSKRSPNRVHRLSRSDPGRFGSRSGCLSPFQEGKANDGQASDRCKRASGGGLGPSGGGAWAVNVIPLMTFMGSYLIASRIPPGRAVEQTSVDDTSRSTTRRLNISRRYNTFRPNRANDRR